MNEETDTTDPLAIINANASIFRKGAKISYLSMVQIITGFTHGTPITACATLAEVHRDTVRDIYADLRDRLMEPAFDKWVQSTATDPMRSDDEDAAIIDQATQAMFGCHENANCYKRFNAGRRKTRLCRACPIKDYVELYDGDPAQATDLVQLVDNIRDFYRLFGWKEHNPKTIDQRAVFDKRFRHYEIISTAVGHSAFDEEGKLISTEDEFLSLPHFTKVIWSYVLTQ